MAEIEHPKDLILKKLIRDPRGSGDLPLIQSKAIINYDSFITVYSLPNPPTTCMSSGTLVNFDIEPNTFQMAEQIAVKLNITCSSAAVTMVPSPWWFRTIKLRSNKGAGEYLKWWYPDEMGWYLSLMEKNMRDFFEREGMIRFIEGKEELMLCYPHPLNVGESRDVYIPLSASFLDMNSIHNQHMAQTLRLELEFNSDFAISGTTTNITVNNIAIVVRQHELPESEQRMWTNELKSSNKLFQYLDTMQLTDNGKTLTASTLTRYDLQALVGKIPFLLVCIKPSTSPISSDQSRFRPISVGEDATWELSTPSQEPLLGKGVDINHAYLKKEYIRLTGKKPLKGFYILPFTDDIMSSWQGVVSGYRSFIGSKDSLEITFGSAGTAEVHTLTKSGTVGTGTWQFFWDGEYLATAAYNAAVGTIKTNIEASDKFLSMGYTVTFGAALDQASVTVTFGIRNGGVSLDNRNRSVVAIAQEGNLGALTSAITTRGIQGFTTSATYTTEIYAFYFRRLMIHGNGTFSTFTL